MCRGYTSPTRTWTLTREGEMLFERLVTKWIMIVNVHLEILCVENVRIRWLFPGEEIMGVGRTGPGCSRKDEVGRVDILGEFSRLWCKMRVGS